VDAAYDLSEWCDLAGVTPRTVRYYIQQGLLPSPGSSGPGVKYGEGHVRRLRLIRRLQREHLPLSEIRRRLRSLTDDEVGRALEMPATVRSPVADYVQQVLQAGPAARKSAVPLFAAAMMPLRESGAPATGRAEETPGLLERSQWDRMTLTPDIELHVRRPLSRSGNKMIEKLLDYARRLLEEDTP
jgi:DNA-binding transcriptional MerR regulator